MSHDQVAYVTLTLEVDVRLGVPVPQDLAGQISRRLAEWSDGRKPFATEVIEHGITELVEGIVFEGMKRDASQSGPVAHIQEHIRCLSARRLSDV